MQQQLTEFHLFRHGETELNAQQVFQGRLDSPLTALGIQQTQVARSEIAGIRFDAAYCSQTIRAEQTLEGLLGDKVEPWQRLEALAEMDLGEWEGASYLEIEQQFPNLYRQFFKQPGSFKLPAAESFAELQQRALAVFNRLANAHQGEKVLLVSHAAFIKTLLTSLQQRDMDSLWQGPYADHLSHSIIQISADQVYVKQFCGIKESDTCS